MPIPLAHPCSVIIAGPSRSGKTFFLRRLLEEQLIQPFPQRIVIVFAEPQEEYGRITSFLPHSEFVQGPLTETLYSTFNPQKRNLLVIDDQMAEAAKSPLVEKIFTKGSHHRNLTVIFIVQNLFKKGDSMRSTSLNANYLVLYKNARDQSQSGILARQMYPSKWRKFVQVYEAATAPPHSYLLIDLLPDTPEETRLRANIFSNEFDPGTDVYLI